MIQCRVADLSNAGDARLVVELLNIYATDAMGGGEPLSESTKINLIPELAKRPFATVFLAFLDEQPAGLAITFEGFSTFECKPLINIHDMAVVPKFRRQGVCSTLLFYVEQVARERNCCKITLEVLEGNHPAKATYAAAGFGSYQLDPEAGNAMFWQKKLY